MSAPQDAENKAQQSTERFISRRTMLRAVVITVPVVAAFSRNLWAVTAKQCPAGTHFCLCGPHPARCIKDTCTAPNCASACANDSCNGTPSGLIQAPNAPAGIRTDNSFGTSPFDTSKSPIGDGGFSQNPWQ